MASPRASRWPPPFLLLLLPLLLPPPAAPGTQGQPPSPTPRAPSPAPLAGVGLAPLPERGPEREPQPQPPPPQERRGPATPGPSQTAPGPGAATRWGPSGPAAPGGSAATIRNHWPESNTEPHRENITFYQNRKDSSTVASKEGVMVQTSRKNHASSDAPEHLTLRTETTDAGGRNDSSSRINFTISPAGHLPGMATALTSQSNTLASEGFHLLASSSGSEGRTAPFQTKSGPSLGSLEVGTGLSEEVTVHTPVATTSVLSQSPPPALETREPTILSRKRNSLGPDISLLHFSRTTASSPPLDHSSSSGSMEELNNSTSLQSPSVSQIKSTHVATTFTDGVPRTLRSLTLSLGPTNETEGFPEDSKTATTSASVHSSLSAVESRRNSSAEESIEPSPVNELGLRSLHWQNDSPTFRGHHLTSSSEVENGSSVSQTESMSGSVPSTRSGESTARWFLTNSKTFADATGSSASYPEVVNTSVLNQVSDSAPQSRGSNTVLSDSSYSESLSTSSSESLDSSAPRGERSTGEDSRDGDNVEDGTAGAPPRSAYPSATLAGVAERTLRSLSATNAGTRAASPEGGSSAGADSATPRRNATDGAGLVSQSPAASRALGGVTGISYDQVNGTGTEQRTSSDHTDHTYISSTFTKGERTLLSITDNSSSSDIRESSTSYVKSSNSSHSDYSSSSHTQTERSNISSYDGGYAQPSTESLVVHTSNLPSYTSTINMPNTSVVLDTDASSVGDSSSSSGSPLPLPSVSQSHQLFSSALPSTRASVYLLKSASDASPPLSSSPSPLLTSLAVSTPAPLSVSQTTLLHPSSSPVLPRARGTPVTSVQMSTVAASVATLHSSQTAGAKNQSASHQEKTVTESKSLSLVSLTTEPIRAVTVSSPSEVPLPPALTESSTEQTLPATSTSLAPVSPALTTTTPEITQPPMITPGTPSSTAPLITGPAAVQTTAREQFLPTYPEILVPQISTDSAVSTKRNQVHIDATTGSIPPTGVLTSAKELTTRLGIIEEHSPTSHFLRTSPSPQTTDVSTAEVLTPKSATFAVHSSTWSPTALMSSASVSSCATNPCLHDGKCIVDPASRGYRCVCSPSWQGDDCSVDVNECLSNPCPPLAMCNNTQGSFICKCPVGYQLEKGICNLVRTFVTEFKLKRAFLNTTVEKHSDLHEVENEITKTLNVCFSTLPGYMRSTVHASRESNVVVVSLQTTFSMASNVTLFDLADGIQKCVNSCRSSAEVCQFLGSQRRIFRAGSLCKRKSPECDRETSVCTDLDGVALCQCKSGYFQFNKMDHSCRACEDGYRLENETCMSCPFGLGGLNCGNPYQLITVVIAAAGGGLLLILGIALIVTCCRKNKNDISKLIFKSGDFQMSPYAEYPKNPRSQDWGREAIEMHENGSTKNLLQMTDVYYSPTGVRNPELERNGLYPAYTGLPGSRHSCIFPGQYNPSFISDESRRRDYF